MVAGTQDATRWFEKKQVGKKTWNGYRNDLSAIFQWTLAGPRKWLEKNPVATAGRFRKMALKPQARQCLNAKQANELMNYIEFGNLLKI